MAAPVDRSARGGPKKSTLLMGLGLVVALLIAISFAKELIRSYEINQEIEGLKNNIAQLQGQNASMSDFVEYLKTDAYFEQQARLKLGLKDPGEKELVLQNISRSPADSASVTSQVADSSSATDAPNSRDNPSNWLHYFFGG